MTGRPSSRLRWIFAAYGALLLASHAWRALHPFVPTPGPDERLVLVGRQTALAPVDGSPVAVATLDRPARAPGSADPVLLVHGSPGSNREMAGLAERLPDRRVVAPSLPGFGASTRELPDYGFRAHARYLLALMDTLGIARAHLVGYSMGGGVVLSMVDLEPDRVASITLLSAIGVQEYELLGEYSLNRAIHGLQLAALWLARAGLPHFGMLDGTFLGVEYARNFFDSDQRPLRGILRRLTQPVLVIQGERDPLVSPAVAHEHHRIVPQSELAMVAGAEGNHFMPFTTPDRLAPIVADFLRRAEAGQAATRATASPARVRRAQPDLDPAGFPPATGLALALVLLLLAAATLVSEDLACISAGILVSRGTIGFASGALACFAGIVLGDLALYGLGRWLGKTALHRAPLRWLVSPGDLARTSSWFSRRGPWIVLATRFLPGTRLPTYLAAGMLKTRVVPFLIVFLIAAAIWTPLLVGASAVFGRRVLALYPDYQRYALPAFLAALFMIWVAVKLLVPLLTWRGRRLLVSRWRRLTRWEFWPRWAFYPPVALHVLWLALRHRSLLIWTASNPAIPGGGFIGESKADILRGLTHAPERVARWTLLPGGEAAGSRLARITEFLEAERLHLPIVLKPDVGERGDGVRLVRTLDEAEAYLAQTDEPLLAQEYVPGVEYGIFYYRLPGEGTGRIFAITDKRFPAVTGDGVRTLERLILEDDRAVCTARTLLAIHAPRLDDVPRAGDRVTLVELGTHCRGSAFYDGEAVRSPALEAAIDELSRGFVGFWFGRYDVRAPSPDALRAGRDFKVIELNGSGSEATNIYDPSHRLGQAYATLRRQWALAFEIGRRNVAAGARATTWRELLRLMARHRRARRAHVIG